MGDEPIVISSGLVITPESVMSRSFTSAFRGYHPAEVRQFLKRVSDEMAASAAREAELRRSLHEALSRAAHPDLDEATLTNVLGDHAARLIAGARETAASITAEAQQQAEAVIREAEGRADRIREEAENVLARRLAEADSASADVEHQAGAEVRALRERARLEAEATLAAARAQGREMISEARSLRERMLGDLSRRRRTAQLQVEQLHAARDRLVAAYDVVRRTLDQVTAELAAAGPEARQAAEAVALRATDHMVDDDSADASGRPPVPERPLALVANQPRAQARPQQRRVERAVASGGGPVPAPSRRAEERPPAAVAVPDRPPIRPQTVADVAPRSPAATAPSPTARSAAPPEPQAPSAAPPGPQAPTVPAPGGPEPSTVPPPGGPEPSAVPAPAGGGSSSPASKVEELFSRLRAERQARTAQEAPPTPSPAPPPESSPPPGAAIAQAPTPGRGPASPPPAPATTGRAIRQGMVDTEGALEGRDDLLDNVEAGLVRALKRVLQNEQNAVLDGLRRAGPSGAALPSPEEQVDALRNAALPWLQQGARIGVAHACDPPTDPDAEITHPPVEPAARILAEELAVPLRERLVQSLAEVSGGDDPSAAPESVRSAYRQWKTQRLAPAARHHVVAVFALAAFAATPDGAPLQWVVDDEGPCPDCDDNALAGPTPKGTPFPTGQLHPPAHPGCRCLLVPAGD